MTVGSLVVASATPSESKSQAKVVNGWMFGFVVATENVTSSSGSGAASDTLSRAIGTRARTQALRSGAPRRVYTPGVPGSAQGSAPHEVRPASTGKAPSVTISGPPESPPQVSVLPPPAHTMVKGWNIEPHAWVQPESETIGTVASSRSSESPDSLVGPTPQPMTVAVLPAAHSAVSSASTRRSGSRVGGAGVASRSRATSWSGVLAFVGPNSAYCELRSLSATSYLSVASNSL